MSFDTYRPDIYTNSIVVPLSPLLFIIVVEALNVVLIKAKHKGLFNGVGIGKDKIHVSHFQFTDDALIIGDWSLTNIKNLSRIISCFHLASGLKVNFKKSKFYSLGVSAFETNSYATKIGCQPCSFPCTYLGLPVGAKMSKCLNWNPLLERFRKKLSKWKAKVLSFGGRFTLSKSVLNSLGVKSFSNFKAPKSIISKLEIIRRKFFWGGSSDSNKITWIA